MITALCENGYCAGAGKRWACSGTVCYVVEHPSEPRCRFSSSSEPCRCPCHPVE